ncbi:membrane protein insertion efficiency factor YidD [Solwaraspora sp. WMMD406]|uniref:membrane protein insertion efficiency factor YidD n=1 Tax=Solwaraspora sp. WMMD406 TaxID=3016095 RepID=UPI002416B8C8|nr:membrane protein insertion efficiency factor YidD [Solwaraspora sp. WMMD406]MDG4766034.1 membrane protein insertion efficiency factor YidD [Solwaraspora sp. WMMD406]
MIKKSWVTAWENRRRRRRTSRSRFDGCCDCDCCDLGLFSSLLAVGAPAATATRAPALDRMGVAAIRGYRRWLSPYWPGRCRYTPSCSAYGLAAVQDHGLGAGGRMAATRLRRCRPDVPRGTHDPVHPSST